MRINKELKSLSKAFEITFIGSGISNHDCYGKTFCKYFYLIDGKRNNPLTIIKQTLLVGRLLFKKFDSIHIINEQLMIFYYPLLFRQHVVLDIFDSIFLMKNQSNNNLLLLKRIIYAPVAKILVTDQNRKALMPAFTHHKIHILENFPNIFNGIIKQNNSREPLTILYNGWLGKYRGTDVVNKILSVDDKIRVIMAGWFADDESRKLAMHPQVEYKGIMRQEEALTIAAHDADYILCVYAPNSENNINASPNKIYDAIQTRKPLITNKEIKVSKFVKDNNLGIVIEDYNNFDSVQLIKDLYTLKNSFNFNENLIKQYTWENIEGELLNAHMV